MSNTKNLKRNNLGEKYGHAYLPGVSGKLVKNRYRLAKIIDDLSNLEVTEPEQETQYQKMKQLAVKFSQVLQNLDPEQNSNLEQIEETLSSIESKIQSRFELSEIKTVNNFDKDIGQKDFDRLPSDKWTKIGQLRDISIYSNFTDWNSTPARRVFINLVDTDFEKEDSDLKLIIGRASLAPVKGSLYGNRLYSTTVELDPDLHGQGIALELYKFFINELGLQLMSDRQQSKGGKSLWNKLTNDPSITMHAINPESPDGKLIPIDSESFEFAYEHESVRLLAQSKSGLKENGGQIIKGVNTTDDVSTDEIKKQAAKFGNKVSKKGEPGKMRSKNLFNEMKKYGIDFDYMKDTL